MMILFVLVFGSACFVWLGAQFYWAGSCGLSIAIVAITLVFMLFFFIVALLPLCLRKTPFRENATVFTVTIACIYISYLTWSAMASNYDDSCQMNMNDSTNTVLQIVIGCIFTFITILTIAGASSDHVDRKTKDENGGAGQATAGGDLIAEDAEASKPKTKEDEAAALFPVTTPTKIFQGLMVLISMYFGMLFSNWGDAVIGGENDHYYGSMAYTQWVKVIALWSTLALFTVSMTITACCHRAKL
jgi:hypothetical protein